MKKLLGVLAAVALATVGLVAVNVQPAAATPALVQAQVASTASSGAGQSVTLTNVQAGDVLFAWAVSSVQASTDSRFWHESVNDSSSLGWHAAFTGGNGHGGSAGFEDYEGYWPATQEVMVRGMWANVPANISSLTVYQDTAYAEPATTLIVSEWSGVQPQVTRVSLAPTDGTACVGTGVTGDGGNQIACNYSSVSPPGVRIMCGWWNSGTAVSNGLSGWTTVASTDTYGARCIYKVAATTGSALHPTIVLSGNTDRIGYGFTILS